MSGVEYCLSQLCNLDAEIAALEAKQKALEQDWKDDEDLGRKLAAQVLAVTAEIERIKAATAKYPSLFEKLLDTILNVHKRSIVEPAKIIFAKRDDRSFVFSQFSTEDFTTLSSILELTLAKGEASADSDCIIKILSERFKQNIKGYATLLNIPESIAVIDVLRTVSDQEWELCKKLALQAEEYDDDDEALYAQLLELKERIKKDYHCNQIIKPNYTVFQTYFILYALIVKNSPKLSQYVSLNNREPYDNNHNLLLLTHREIESLREFLMCLPAGVEDAMVQQAKVLAKKLPKPQEPKPPILESMVGDDILLQCIAEFDALRIEKLAAWNSYAGKATVIGNDRFGPIQSKLNFSGSQTKANAIINCVQDDDLYMLELYRQAVQQLRQEQEALAAQVEAIKMRHALARAANDAAEKQLQEKNSACAAALQIFNENKDNYSMLRQGLLAMLDLASNLCDEVYDLHLPLAEDAELARIFHEAVVKV